MMPKHRYLISINWSPDFNSKICELILTFGLRKKKKEKKKPNEAEKERFFEKLYLLKVVKKRYSSAPDIPVRLHFLSIAWNKWWNWGQPMLNQQKALQFGIFIVKYYKNTAQESMLLLGVSKAFALLTEYEMLKSKWFHSVRGCCYPTQCVKEIKPCTTSTTSEWW